MAQHQAYSVPRAYCEAFNMENMTDDEEGRSTPPYLSPTTFLNFIDAHRRTLPTRIDRSIMPNLAGGAQVRIIKALQFFNLISEDGTPSQHFHKMETLDDGEMAEAWATLLRHSYPYLFDGFNLGKATQGQIEERFREQGIKGDTVRKAVAFFIGLARVANVSLSPYFKASRRRGAPDPRGARKPRRAATMRRENQAPPKAASPLEPSQNASHSAKVVRFRSGGTAELRVDVDVVSLSREDREALFAWIDAMSEYEEKDSSGHRIAAAIS